MKMRSVAGPAILLLWAGVLGMHVRREYFKSGSTVLAEGARMLAPGRHWYAVRMNQATIGVGSSRLDTLNGRFMFEDDLTLDVPATGTVHRSRARTSLTLSSDLTLQDFAFDLTSEIGNFAVKGVVRADSTIALTMNAGGEEQTATLPAERGMLLDAAVPLRLAAAGELATGSEFTVRVFDPSAMASRDVTMKVTARDTLIVADSAVLNSSGQFVASRYDTVPTWKIEQRFGGAIISTWVDDDGQIVRAESPLGFTIERTYSELARQEWRNARVGSELAEGYGALIQGTAISSNVDLSGLADIDQLRVRLGNVDLTGFDLVGGRQQLSGDTLTITRESAQRSAGYTLPYRGGGEAAAELTGSPLIQIDEWDPLESTCRHASLSIL